MFDDDCAEDATRLQLWYKSLATLRVDIVGDFAGKELFAIHGDSLLLHCITGSKVDFVDGFQLLHAIFSIETFLDNLRQRGCHFHIVWFADHEELCVPKDAPDVLASGYRLLRAIASKHLAQYTKIAKSDWNHISFQFTRVEDDDFRGYLTRNAVHFFLTLDTQEFDRHSEAISTQHLKFIRYLTLKGYSLAFINNLKFASSKVHVSVCSPSPRGGSIQVGEFPRVSRVAFQSFSELGANSDIKLFECPPWEDGELFSTRDIVSLIGLSNVLLANSGNDMKECVVAYIIHLSVLRRLDLSHRSCRETPLSERQTSALNDFFAHFSNICISIVETISVEYRWDAFDLFDGRILRQVLWRLQTLTLTAAIATEVCKLAGLIYQLTHVDVSECIPSSHVSRTECEIIVNERNALSPSVLPFSHPALDEFFAPINSSTAVSPESQSTNKVFEELSHWHNARVLIDPRNKIQRQGFFAKRRNQRLMASIITYSASLANISGTAIHPETIVSSPTESSANTRKEKRRGLISDTLKQGWHQHNVEKSAVQSHRQSALEEVQRIQGEKMKNKTSMTTIAWDERSREFESEMNMNFRCLKIAKYLAGLSSRDTAIIGGEAALYLCNSIALMLLEAKKGDGKAADMPYLAILWSKLIEINTTSLPPEGIALFELLVTIVKMPIITVANSAVKGRKLPFPGVTKALGRKLLIAAHSLEFQLTHCGPYLERGFDSAPDHRVQFSPDAWQKRVLDAIDADKSLFVVAPTSSGKTFISFYAMKKVLQSNDDDILVYVAPTKALVNQIAAEVQARFSKSYSVPGRSVWAVHTRDYRINNPTGCQVLITVPHILQIMLLAPSNSKTVNAWSLRVKRIIFDEVHCIGQSDDGVIWEQLLLLAPCPIIALSATVGNPMEFNAWLERTEKAKGHDLTMIVHPYRYSDLRKFIYFPSQGQKFSGLKPIERLPIGLGEEQPDTSPFRHVHPVASLINRYRTTLDDISLEPRDCFILWQSWMQNDNSPFSSIRNDLQSSITHHRLRSPDHSSELSLDDLSNATTHPRVKKAGLHTFALQLLSDLHHDASLPAILFNYDRKYCEKIVLCVEEQLRDAEEAWKTSSPEWSKKLIAYNKWKITCSKAGPRVKEGKFPHEDGGSKNDGIKEAANKDVSPWESFDPDAAIEQFSFTDRKKLLDSEFEAMVASLKHVNLKPEIIDALRRGMGVHHAGMNREYRQVVEILFRKGFLRVVVATGTLAMGINMPCKTVVFFGDSVYLTALNYNQAAGRAGRRGFDPLGNIVFVGVAPERVFEIMSSRLPDLRGQFPLSTTLVLRLLGLLHGTGNSDFSLRAMRSIQSQTRLYLGGASSQITIKHHMRFSIEYLQRQHLLSHCGAPLNFAGLVGHLYFTENAVFAFHALLKSGYFHELCAPIHQKQQDVLLQLVNVLAHLFCRIPLRLRDNDEIKNKIHRSPSVVVLPRLPKQAETILCGHNEETLRIFRDYVSSFINNHLTAQADNQLPFTKYKIQGNDSGSAKSVIDHLPATKLRSPFVALSGFTDDFQSIHDLCTTVRDGVFLEESAVPYIPIHPNGDARIPWNAYIYDFFKHGDMEALVRDNGIKGGDVWFLLKDFSLILATIVTSLGNFFKLGSVDDDAAMMAMQDVGDAEESADDHESQVINEVHSVAPQKIPPPSLKKIRKVVVDSWEDDLSTGSSESEDTDPIQTDRALNSLSTSETSASIWPKGEEESLMLVLTAFQQLQKQFDEAFKKVWA